MIVNKKGIASVEDLTNGEYCITGERKNLAIRKGCEEKVLYAPAITISGEEVEDSGYYLNQTLSVVFDNTNTYNPEYFIKTTKAGTSNVNVTKVCGNGSTPGSCTTIEATNNLLAGEWYKVDGNIDITYSEISGESGTISAVMKEGERYLNTDIEDVGKITVETNYTLNHHQMNTDGTTYTLTETDT